MVQSVELLLDPAADEEVRRDWERLAVAGLPSQARHAGQSSRPHVTVAVAEHLDPVAEHGVAATATTLEGRLPVPLVLDGLVIFPGRRAILARSVTASTALLRVQRAFADVMAGFGPVPETLRPARWTPHVTLARGLTGAQLARAVDILGHRRIDAAAVAIRRWDGSGRREWILCGEPPATRSAQ